MEKILSGKALNRIEPHGGLIAGQPRWYELWVTGGTIQIRDSKTISIIERAMKDAKRLSCDTCDYVRFVLIEEA